MKITWYGHSAFRIDHGGNAILIDPFLNDNPSWDGDWKGPGDGVTHVLLTHGHDDHIGDTVDICKETGAVLVASFEICMLLVGRGVSQDKINPGNNGGTIDCGGFTTSFVFASHSSSTQSGGGDNIYLGNPSGLVLHFPDAQTVYHMGDADILGDMALINELHQPKIGMVPVGDRFTMGGALAALACRRYFDFDAILPCHYGTFPVLDPDSKIFVEAMEGDSGKVRQIKPGDSIDF